jgi:RNA polymerase sigma-70 factor (ECF subfamily)
MAAGTIVETMTMATANEIAAQDFSAVVAAHRPQIFRFLLASTRDVDLAETLTQECFLKAHRNWGRFRGDSSAMTWLMRIAINLQKDHWRNRRMQFWRQARTNSVDLDEASEWLPSGESSVEQQLLARERVGQVWKAVEGLSERQRTVFLLRYVEEKELSEIAAATGLSEGTVKAHLSRALAKVRTELGGRR